MALADPGQAVIALAVPVAATLVGAAVGLWRVPGCTSRAACQHLAAGIVLAAVATELVPPLVHAPHWLALGLGFSLGVALMLLLRRVFDDGGAADASPVMLTGLGIDLFIDGLLVGLALQTGHVGGLVMAGAVGFETLFLGLATAAMLAGRRGMLVLVAIGLSIALAVGGVGGLLLADVMTGPWRVGLLAFGCAALLYLVTEELLVEAHRRDAEKTWVTALFFAGFGVTLAIAAAAG